MYQSSRITNEADGALLDSAIRQLGAHGLRGATMRDIAETAGVSPALVNYRFGSRARLIEAALHRACLLDEAAWNARCNSLAAVELTTRDLRSVLHAVLRDDFLSKRHLALLRWACIVETERSDAYADLSWRWMSNASRFWTSLMRKFDRDPAIAAVLGVTLFSTGLPYLFAESSFEREAWVHDVVERIADRLLGVAPAALGDSAWRVLAESAAEDRLAENADAGETAPIRRTIVDGAVAVISAHGVDALTHRAVAERAGVALSSTTHHFASLEEILIAACIEVYRRARARALDSSGVLKPFSFEDLKAGMIEAPGPGADLRSEMASIHEIMIAISRTESVRPIAVGLLAQTGRTSTAALAALTPKRGETDRIDGQIFAHVMTAHILMSICAPDADRSDLPGGVAATVSALWG